MLRIEEWRNNKGLSKNKICQRAEITMHTYLAIEAGGDVRLSTLRKIAAALGVDVVDLFERGGVNDKI